MNTENPLPTIRRRSQVRGKAFAAKAVECRDAHRQLNETSLRLAGVRAKIRNALRTRCLTRSDQLESAQRAIDTNLKAVARSLDRLRKAGDLEWETQKTDLEGAWEDLHRSVKRLVAVLDDSPYV